MWHSLSSHQDANQNIKLNKKYPKLMYEASVCVAVIFAVTNDVFVRKRGFI